MSAKLRSGYTTGACAAAAAKAAAALLLKKKRKTRVDIVFPDSTVVRFPLIASSVENDQAMAAVIKDAGDDPDVTNRARIEAHVRLVPRTERTGPQVIVKGGKGVGMVTKPGLAVAVGEPAINPVPLKMILLNVTDALKEHNFPADQAIVVTIVVPDGEALAKKTLNARLGIIGGISILGTTGIVRPISADAWTATIRASMDVAQANDVDQIVLSTGRTSERCVQRLLKPPEEALVMMGDYLDFSLKEIRRYRFTRIHVATMWAKLLKGAMGHGHTHVRHGVIDCEEIYQFFLDHNIAPLIVDKLRGSNTAREILERLMREDRLEAIHFVCDYAAEKYREISGIPVSIHLVNGSGSLICSRSQ